MLPYCVEVYATSIVSYTILERRYVTGPSVSFPWIPNIFIRNADIYTYIYNVYNYVN